MNEEDHVEKAYAEFVEAWHAGKAPDPSAYCIEHADCGPELEERIENFLFVASDFFDGSLAKTGGDKDGQSVVHGLELGDFKVLREIGRGGMGVVYEAEQKSLNRKVALKVLSNHLGFSGRAVDKFRREAEAAGRQKHPGIVAIHAVGEEDGVHFIAQELVEGGCTLADKLDDLKREGVLPVGYFRRAAKVIARVADALGHAHANGVIHRDVKPSNILLTVDGEIKVSDFGLAKVEDALALTRTGDFSGTPYYMSPEQADSRKTDIGLRTDVYSLGVALYETLTLQRPFEAGTSPLVLKKIVNDEPRDPRKVSSRVPVDLAVICLKAMEKKPDHRYPSMAEFAADLRRYLAGEPILARPAGVVTKVGKRVRRNPALSGALGLAAFAILGFLIYLMWSYPTILRERDNALAAQVIAQCTAMRFEDQALALLLGTVGAEKIKDYSANNALIQAILDCREIMTIYTGPVMSVDFAPDGAVITAARDGTVRVWDAASGMEMARSGEPGEAWPLNHAEISSLGDRIVAASYDKTAKLFTYSNDEIRPVGSLEGHENELYSARFSEDGKKIVTASDGLDACIWDAVTGKLIFPLCGHTWAVRHAAFGADDKTVVTASEDTFARLWDVTSGEVINVFPHKDVVRYADCSPDGEQIITACDDGIGRIWEVLTDEEEPVLLEGHEDLLTCCAFSPDGSKALTASRDKTLRIWDVADREELLCLRGHRAAVVHAAWNETGDRVATASEDGTVKVWDVTFHMDSPGWGDPVFSPCGSWVARVNGSRIRIYDTASNHVTAEREIDGKIKSIHFSPDGGKVVIISLRSFHWKWNHVRNEFYPSEYLGSDVLSLAFSPDSLHVMITFSKDYYLIGRLDKRADERKDVERDAISFVRLAPDGATVLMITERGDGRILDRATMEPIKFGEGLRSGEFSADGSLLMTLSELGRLTLWDTATRETLPSQEPMGWTKVARFSPDGKRILVVPEYGLPTIRHLDESEDPIVLAGLRGTVEFAVFDPQGDKIMLASAKGDIRIWDVRTGKLFSDFYHNGSLCNVGFTSDGEWALTASEDGRIMRWPMKPLDEALRKISRRFTPQERIEHHIPEDWTGDAFRRGPPQAPCWLDDPEKLQAASWKLVLDAKREFGDYRHVLELTSRALEIDSGNLECFLTLGAAKYRYGSNHEALIALRYYEENAESSPDSNLPAAYAFMAMACKGLGRLDEARQFIEKAGKGPEENRYPELLKEAEEMIIKPAAGGVVTGNLSPREEHSEISGLLFVQIDRSQNQRLAYRDPALGTIHPLSESFENTGIYSISSSSSGKICYLTSTESNENRIFVREFITGLRLGDPTTVFEESGRCSYRICLHPKTATTFFDLTETSELRCGNQILRTSPDDGQTFNLLARPLHTFKHPGISPDGRWIVYQYYPGHSDAFESEIWISHLGPVGRYAWGRKRLTCNGFCDYEPCFSPDGGTIYYLRQERPAGPFKVCIYDLARESERILMATGHDERLTFSNLSVDPSSGLIAYDVNAKSGKWIDVVDPTGTRVFQIKDPQWDAVCPCFIPTPREQDSKVK